MGDLIHLYGETDGSSTTGTFSLQSDMFYSSVSYIRIPKGVKAKIWCKRIAGAAVDVKVEFTHDVTETSPTWSDISHESLASAGELTLEKRRPIVLMGRTGKEAFRASWSQGTAGNSYVEFEVELSED